MLLKILSWLPTLAHNRMLLGRSTQNLETVDVAVEINDGEAVHNHHAPACLVGQYPALRSIALLHNSDMYYCSFYITLEFESDTYF